MLGRKECAVIEKPGSGAEEKYFVWVDWGRPLWGQNILS